MLSEKPASWFTSTTSKKMVAIPCPPRHTEFWLSLTAHCPGAICRDSEKQPGLCSGRRHVCRRGQASRHPERTMEYLCGPRFSSTVGIAGHFLRRAGRPGSTARKPPAATEIRPECANISRRPDPRQGRGTLDPARFAPGPPSGRAPDARACLHLLLRCQDDKYYLLQQ